MRFDIGHQYKKATLFILPITVEIAALPRATIAPHSTENKAEMITTAALSWTMKRRRFPCRLVKNWGQLMGVLLLCALFGFQREVMIANVLMLVMFYFLLVVPILWCLRPAKLVKRF